MRASGVVELKVPFNRPAALKDELLYVQRAIASSQHSGNGPFTVACEQRLQQALGSEFVSLTTSCTHALEMAGLLLDLKSGDEVIVPSFTFVSTANAFALRGAHLVFADVRPDTLNIDEEKLPSLITSRTRALVVVHYAGIACEMNRILTIANAHGIKVIEDNAHGLFGAYRDKSLGTFGCMSTLSFHETKNFSCGEGGALVINDPGYIERAEIVREKGTDRSRFFRGMVDKYSWVGLGSSYLPSDILAAYLLGQLENHEFIQKRRSAIWKRYARELTDWASAHDVVLPTVPSGCEPAYHIFYLRMPSLAIRQRIIAHLRSAGILAPFHYLPLHLSKMGKQFGGKPGDCPVAEKASDQLLRLPLFNSMTDHEFDMVIAAVKSFDF